MLGLGIRIVKFYVIIALPDMRMRLLPTVITRVSAVSIKLGGVKCPSQDTF